MARYRFQPGKEYPARLLAIRERPIENRDGRLHLLRLEFEIFLETGGKLCSLGKIACRDLVIGPESARDTGVLRYARALQVTTEDRLADWLAAGDSGRWVSIVFGEPDPEDERNPFVEIATFGPSDFRTKVAEYDLTVAAKWVPPEVAADELGCSTATVRRKADRLRAEWGSRLVCLTPGGHRRINLPLLRELELTDQRDSLRVVELRRLRELTQENLTLKKQLVNREREISALVKRVTRLQG